MFNTNISGILKCLYFLITMSQFVISRNISQLSILNSQHAITKILAPLIYITRIIWLQDTVNIIVESACTLIKSWDNVVKAEDGVAELIVDEYVRNFTSEIISKMMFGNNFFEGMKLFPKLKTLIDIMSTPTLLSGVPFSRYVISLFFVISFLFLILKHIQIFLSVKYV